MVSAAVEAAAVLEHSSISACVFDPVWLKPAPVDQIRELAENRSVITIEEGSLAGGFGSFIASVLPKKNVLSLGIPDSFVPHAQPGAILAELNLDPGGIARSAEGHFRETG